MIIMVFSPIFSHWVFKEFYPYINAYLSFSTGFFDIKYYDEHWSIQKIIDQLIRGVKNILNNQFG
jgi:E3 ubiquitin-protein ligase DOA10